MGSIIFDWDGTIISCEEKINGAIAHLCTMYPQLAEDYRRSVLSEKQSPGWWRKGVQVALPEDYFCHHFGIVTDLLSAMLTVDRDEAWNIALTSFKTTYCDYPSTLMLPKALLDELANRLPVYILSNSSSDNIQKEALDHNILTGITFVGGAKKYSVSSDETLLCGISPNRPGYLNKLLEIQKEHGDILVIGDNFSLDISTPLSQGMQCAYIPNPFSPPHVINYLRGRNVRIGSAIDIVSELIK